jgi:putative membrane protein
MRLILVWLVNSLALAAVAWLMPSIRVESLPAALGAALVLGLVNTVVRPVLILLTLPATILTLGLFIFILNALLFWMVGHFVQGFVVPDFWSAFFGSIAYSIVSWLLAALVLPGPATP